MFEFPTFIQILVVGALFMVLLGAGLFVAGGADEGEPLAVVGGLVVATAVIFAGVYLVGKFTATDYKAEAAVIAKSMNKQLDKLPSPTSSREGMLITTEADTASSRFTQVAARVKREPANPEIWQYNLYVPDLQRSMCFSFSVSTKTWSSAMHNCTK
jgi:hypothetical protein